MSCIPVSIPNNELKSLYEKKKLTTYEIADIYNCCQATIWKRLHQFGVKARFPWNDVDLPKKKLENLYKEEKLSTWAIEEKLKIPRSTIYKKLLEYGIKRRNRAESHIIYPRKDFDGTKIDKAYLIGFAMGDLRVRKVYPNSETILIDCSSSKIEQINLISKLFKPYGRVWIKDQPNRKGYIQTECSVNSSFDFLLKKRILMDRWISKNKKYFAAFFAGFTDAEGCISINKLGQAFYSLGNYNYKLLGQIRNQLMRFGIHCTKLTESKTKGKKFGKQKHIHNQNYWHFSIHRKLSLLNLFDLISPYLQHGKRIKDMERARQNIKLRNKKYGNINMNL